MKAVKEGQRLESERVNKGTKANGIQTEGRSAVTEKMMVCVSGSPFSRELIRTTRQMADHLKIKWAALYVDTPKRVPKTMGDRMEISRNLRIAEDLGAETFTVSGTRISDEIISFARKHNVRHIVIGKPKYSRIIEWVRPSVVDQVIRKGENITFHVIPGRREIRTNAINYIFPKHSVEWTPYLILSGIIIALTLLLRLLGPANDLVNVALLFLMPVLFGALRWGMGPGFYASLMSILSFDFFFVPPVQSFTVADLRYILSFAVFLIVAMITASLSSKLKNQLKEARENEKITLTLYTLGREMTVVDELQSTMNRIVLQISDKIGFQAAIYLPDKNNELEVAACSTTADWAQLKAGGAIAKWVYLHGEMAGRGTQTLSESPGLFIPLRTEDFIHGVMVIYYGGFRFPDSLEHKRLIEAIAGLVATAIARIKLQEEAKKAQLAAESEKLRAILLDSISHELRTPLSAIIGSVTALSDHDEVFGPEDRQELLATIRQGAVRMNRLITNLLGMVRLESGMLHLNRQWCDLEDIIGVSMKQIEDSIEKRELCVEINDSFPPIKVDELLFEQMLANILSNAVKYSADKSRIVISACQKGGNIEINIKDQGIGVPLIELDHIFDKFYRLKTNAHVPGTGLGLAIAKGIIKAHGGSISAKQNLDKGITVSISLPMKD